MDDSLACREPSPIRASVCMATHNAGPYLRGQVDSILAQLGNHDELVIADDGSTDGTLDTLAQYQHPAIRFHAACFGNPTRTFEFALRHARGKVIFLSDQDDEWYPQKLARMLTALEDCDLAVSDCEVVDGSGALIARSYFALNHSRPGIAANLWRNSYLGCCMAFRRELLACALPIPDKLPHDMWIGLIAEIAGRRVLLREPLMRFRRHDRTTSYAAKRSGRSLYERLAARFHIASALAARYIEYRLQSKDRKRA